MPTLGTEVFAPGLSLHAGGGAFITGATLAAMGHDVWQFSVLPAPPFDAIVQAEMTGHGIVASACKPSAVGADPQITVAIGTQDDRAFLTRMVDAAVPDLANLQFSDFSHLHVGELRTLQETPALLANARSAGLTVSLDCSWQDSYDKDAAALIADIDVFLPNEREAAALAASGIAETCARLTVVKCGRNGARARGRNDPTWTRHAGVPTKVLDATGAGDAFNAGFLSCWLDRAPLERCLAKGNACGAAAVQVIGGATNLKHAISA
ncbi:MAG: PfkB family carbohydrate kinase [Jannaschia sp.]